MGRKKIALILPIRFAVRGFLQTDVLTQLRDQADLLLLSPFADSPDFVAQYSGIGIEHVLLKDFIPKGRHNTWYRRYNEVQQRHLGLFALKNKEEIRRYHIKQRNLSFGRISRLKLFLRKQTLPWIAANEVGLRLMQEAERTAYRRATYEQHLYYHAILKHHRPDLVVSTSPNRYFEIPVARAVEELEIPHIAYILSFDNIVCYPDYPRIYDKYMVWNERNKSELLARYPGVKEEQIVICGPLQFDFYAQKKEYLINRHDWLAQYNLAPNKPVILYAETGPSVAPHEVEIVSDLYHRLRALPSKDRPSLLVRTHPMHSAARWNSLQDKFPDIKFQSINQSQGNGLVGSGVDFMNWDKGDIAQLINTLQHVDVHMNIASTMSLDAAYFDRPSIGIAYDPRPNTPFGSICHQIYSREHLVGIMQSGGLALALTPEEAIKHIQRYLAEPSQDRAGRERMVQAYDPFRDGKAAERVVNVITEFLK